MIGKRSRWCANGTGDRDLDRYFCTLAIDSGDLSTETLAITFNNRGITYNEKGDYDRAIEDYDRAIRLDSDFALAFNNRGIAYRHKGQYDRAITDYDEAIRLKPDLAEPFNNRGLAYAAKGEYDRVIADYDQAIRLDSTDLDYFNNRGYAKIYLGRFAAAVPDLARVVENDPDSAYGVIWFYLAEARAGQGGFGELEANAGHLDLNEWPGPVISMYLGSTDAEAVAAMGAASATKAEREKRCEAMFYVGEYYLLSGDRRKAAEFFRAAVATEVTYFIEYTGAKAELARLGS